MVKRIGIVIGIVLACLVVIFTLSKSSKPTIVEETTQQFTEEQQETEELNIRIPDSNIPQRIEIGQDGKQLSTDEIAEEQSIELENILEEASKAVEESREEETILEETIAYSEMQELEEDINDYVKDNTIDMMRHSAKTEVEKYKKEGNQLFMDITDEMIDSYTEEELNNLMILVYQNIKY